MKMTHRKCLEKTLAGQSPDRIPWALWHHFPVDDQDPIALVKATLAFQDQFGFDLIKVMPPSSFCLKDWGAEDEWQGNLEGTRAYVRRPIQKPEDWYSLQILDPYQGYLNRQLECLAYLKQSVSPGTPYLQTIFNPLSQAKNLVGPENLSVHLRQYPDALHTGLKTILETTLRFIDAAKGFGISGIFLAIQHASFQVLTKDEYQEFGCAYVKLILETVNNLWINVAHLHENAVMFDLIAKYPVQVLNWHDRETPPNLSEGLQRFAGSVCGGISRINSLVLGAPEKIKTEARQAIEQTNGQRLILGTGCVLPLNTPFGNIMALHEIVKAT